MKKVFNTVIKKSESSAIDYNVLVIDLSQFNKDTTEMTFSGVCPLFPGESEEEQYEILKNCDVIIGRNYSKKDESTPNMRVTNTFYKIVRTHGPAEGGEALIIQAGSEIGTQTDILMIGYLKPTTGEKVVINISVNIH